MPDAPRRFRLHPPAKRSYLAEKNQPSRRTSYRHWYQLAVWKQLRAAVLARDCYLCKACERRGIIKPVKEHTTRDDADNQAHADHLVPHNGDWDLFISMENLETKCGTCHRARTQGDQNRAKRI